MSIVYKLGDMFESDERVYVHSTNAQGLYNSGIAGIMRKRHPNAYKAYRDAYETFGLHLGEIIWAVSEGILIGNMTTQEFCGRDPNVVYCDYDAIRTALRTVNEAVKGEFETVGMPMISSGLANGDWSIISKIIEEESTDFTPVVYILDPKLYASAIRLGSGRITR